MKAKKDKLVIGVNAIEVEDESKMTNSNVNSSYSYASIA